jgi:hypothetical protein
LHLYCELYPSCIELLEAPLWIELQSTRIRSHEKQRAWHRWLTSVILATWEAEIGRIYIQGQPRLIVLETSSPKLQEQNGLEVCSSGRASCVQTLAPLNRKKKKTPENQIKL